METFFEYWKKGWKVWLMIFCLNLLYFLASLPVAFVVIKIMGVTNKGAYFFICGIVGLIFFPPLAYKVLEFFYGEQ